MAITFSKTYAAVSKLSGLATVTDSLSFAQGGAAVFGSRYGTTNPMIEIYDGSGNLVRSITSPFTGTPLSFCHFDDGSFLISFRSAGVVYALRLSQTGNAISEPMPLAGERELLALSDGKFMAIGGGGAFIYEPFGTTFFTEEGTTLGVGGDYVTTRLANGNIAVAWSYSGVDGTEVSCAVIGEDGSYVSFPRVFDTFGSINVEPDIVATPEGFVVSYVDNGYLLKTDVTLAYFGSAGDLLGYEQLTNTAGTAEQTPTLTLLDGAIAASWVDNSFSTGFILTRLVSDTYADFVVNPSEYLSFDFVAPQTPEAVAVSGSAYLTFWNKPSVGAVQLIRSNYADVVTGDAADDFYAATKNVEFIDLGGGSDTVSYAKSTAGVMLYVINGISRGGYADQDRLENVEIIVGSAFGDRMKTEIESVSMSGGAGSDTLIGGLGADTLAGGTGRDVLYASGRFPDSSTDRFIFRTAAETAKGSSRDVVINFSSGIDDIVLTAIDADTSLAGNQRFAFANKTAAENAIWYKVSGADVIVSGDTNGDKVADFEILLKGIGVVNATDFLL